MFIVERKISLKQIEDLEPSIFSDMVKGVADIQKEIIAIHSDMHADCEALLLDNGSLQENLVGFNIYYDGEIELDSNINPPVNKRLGYPRAGRLITDPEMCAKVEGIIRKWVDIDV